LILKDYITLEADIYAIFKKVCNPSETEKLPNIFDAAKAIREKLEDETDG